MPTPIEVLLQLLIYASEPQNIGHVKVAVGAPRISFGLVAESSIENFCPWKIFLTFKKCLEKSVMSR